MASVLLDLTIASVLVTIVFANDYCATYRAVKAKDDQCWSQSRRAYSSNTGDKLRDDYVDFCSSSDAHTSCMSDITEGCSNSKVIMTEVSATWQICANWVQQYIIPDFNSTVRRCIGSVNPLRLCWSIPNGIPWTDAPELVLHDVRQSRNAQVGCAKTKLQEYVPGNPWCQGLDWRRVYALYLVHFFSLKPLFGMVPDYSSMSFLRAYAKERLSEA